MNPIIYNINNAIKRPKMAAFDYDWTIVNPKDGNTFSSSMDDWVWFSSVVPEKIKNYYKDDYMIVIFTNQSKSWKCEQIKLVMKQLEIPIFIVVATKKEIYKPNPISFSMYFEDCVDKEKSFFVGDALGRKTDFSDSDLKFAENIGIKCYSPEAIFLEKNTFDIPSLSLSLNPEVIIMVGYPGSGKSTIAENICKNNNYIHITGDIHKTSSKMMKFALPYVSQSKSIIFDATHSSVKKRKELVDFSKNNNYEVKCIHVTTSLEESYKRNRLRCEEKQVPKIAYSVFKKYYEEPNEDEGFTLITI